MKPRLSKKRNHALTLIEVNLAIVLLVVLAAIFLLPMLAAAKKKSSRISCATI
jgi:type II secretory pathway pseudopilin PulG